MTEQERPNAEVKVQRLGERLHRLVPVLDSAGRVIQYAITPLKVELRRKDVLQIIAGASILAVPVAFTEETWRLSVSLPTRNVALLAGLSIVFVAGYVQFNFYRDLFHEHMVDFIKRVLVIYFISLIIVALLLSLIQQAPWLEDPVLALKRSVLITFPATMSAAISDAID